MKRLLVFVCAGAAVLLALRHPAPAPAILASAAPPASQHAQKGHPSHVSGEAIVYVVGAVAHPGLYRLQPGARINDAVQRAGGLRADADPAAINLAQHVSDGDEIHVLRLGENAPVLKRSRSKRAPASRTAVALSPEGSIDLNSADANTLSTIPGIGPTLAARIVEYRRLNGPFASLDELADVAGMTQRRIDAMSAYVTVGRLP